MKKANKMISGMFIVSALVVSSLIITVYFSACSAIGIEVNVVADDDVVGNGREINGENEKNLMEQSWKTAYAELLRTYTELPLNTTNTMEAGWYFALHDIDRDGTPELLLAMSYYTGHMSYRLIYSFTDGNLTSLAFENVMTDGGLFAPLDNSPFILIYSPAGFGGMYERLKIYESRIATDYRGYFRPNEALLEIIKEGENVDGKGYDWFELYINPYPETELHLHLNPVDIEEFESLFGSSENRLRVNFIPISESTINDLIMSN